MSANGPTAQPRSVSRDPVTPRTGAGDTPISVPVERLSLTQSPSTRSLCWTAGLLLLLFTIGATLSTRFWPITLAATLLIALFAIWSVDKIGRSLLIFATLTITFSGVAVGPFTAPDLFLIPAGLLFTGRWLLARRRAVPIWLLIVGAIIFGSGLLPFLFLETVPDRAAVTLAQFTLSFFYVPIVLLLGIRERSDLHLLVCAFVVSAALSAFLGLLHFGGISDMASRLTGYQGYAYNSGRVTGLAVHPNQLGLTCALAFPFAAYLSSRNRRWSLCLLILVGGVLVSGSRAGMLALVLSAVLYLRINGLLSTARLVKVVIGFLLIALLASTLGFNAVVGRIVDDAPLVIEADAARASGLRDGVDDVLDYPLTGVGFGEVPHILYLEIWQGAGVLALLAFAYFATRILQLGRRLSFDPYARNACACHVLWLLIGFLQPGLYDRYLYFPAGLILGAAYLYRASVPAPTSPYLVSAE